MATTVPSKVSTCEYASRTLPTAHAKGLLPLSSAQTGMLFQTLWHPTAGFYIQQFAVRLRQKINPELMRQTWDFLANRYDSLRYGFVLDEQKVPKIRVAPRVAVPFTFEDWSGQPGQAHDRRLARFLRKDRSTPVGLEIPPLMRVALVRLGPAEYTLVWTSHHLLFDGRSRYLILRDLSKVYQALNAGKSPSLPRVEPYSRFLQWIANQDFGFSEPYWRRVLEGISEPTPVGLELARESSCKIGSKRLIHTTRLSISLLNRLADFCTTHDLTPNTLLQGAWAIVLSRYSRRQHVVFGAPRAGRHGPVPGLASMVGMLVNTVPVRARVEDERPVLEFLHELRENWLELRPHEQTPLRDIHKWCRMPDGRELFDSLVGFENFQMAERLATDDPWWHGASTTLTGWTNFALTIQAYRGEGLELVFTYDPNRFSTAAIRRLGAHLRTTLTGFLSSSVRTLGELPLLTKRERRRLCIDWNATATAGPWKQDVSAVFSRAARRTPNATALILNNQTLSYKALDESSTAIGRWLQAEGIGRDARVGVLLERSFAVVEVILGILKAGAAYVPLDPEYPQQRLAFMITDADVRLVLGSETCQAALADLPIRFETAERAQQAGRSLQPVRSKLAPNPDAPAYVMYTSGSTGTPKGVVVPHRGILRLVFGVNYVALGPERTLLQMAPVSFDASIFELFGALLHGARCVLYPYRRPQINELARQIKTHRVDTAFLTTALFNFIIDEEPEALRPLRQLLTGGEVQSPAHIARALACLTATQISNIYGPTEATTFACCYPIAQSGFDATAPVPIGRPIGNTTCYVLDRRMRPVAIGVEGELYIGGMGVALGYLKRPKLSAERFIPNPFSAVAGELLYRTGDLVAWRDDGQIDFRGRIDDQVKIRGFRVEPGEIVRTLQNHPKVKQAAVVVIATATAGKELAAFYTTRDIAAIDGASLRLFLSEQLPAYMIPASFTAVTRIPVTVNGKVDRTALLQVTPTNDGRIKTPKRPANAVERRLAALWMEILTLKTISVNESFFELGGTSLGASRLLHLIRERFGVEVPYHTLLAHSTIQGLSRLLRRSDSAVDEPSLETFLTKSRGNQWRVAGARAKTVRNHFQPENLHRRNVVRIFRLKGALEVDRLVDSIRRVTCRHEALSTHYRVDESGDVFQARSHGKCPVAVLDLSTLSAAEQNAEVRRICSAEENRIFDSEAEWMHRYRLLVLSSHDHVLVLNFHHLNFDGTSLNTFYRECSEIYRASLTGFEPDLTTPAPQQNDVHDWLEQWLAGDRLTTLRKFWRSTLTNLPVVEFPLIKSSDGYRNGAGNIEQRVIDGVTTDQLRRRARSGEVTLYQLCLAGFIAVLARVGRNRDVPVGIVTDLRTHESLSTAMGDFANLPILRTNLEGDPCLSKIISRVSVQMRAVLAHRYFPFDDFYEFCGSEDPLEDPLRRVRFIQSMEQEQLLEFPNVTSSVIPREARHARGIFSVHMREVPDGIELRASHTPAVLPTETVKSMLSLYEFILKAIASEKDPRLSELPHLGGTRLPPDSTDGALHTRECERKLLDIFREVLHHPQAGPLDSFFELGGHSLLAAKILHRIEQQLGLTVPLCLLFENPTPRKLAVSIAATAARVERPDPAALIARPRNRREKVGLFSANWIEFLRQKVPRNITRAFSLRGPLVPELLQRSLQWVVDRHDALRTRLMETPKGIVREVAPLKVDLCVRNIDVGTNEQRWVQAETLIAAESDRVFGLDSFPLHVFSLLRLAEEEHILVLNFHHIFFDGNSVVIFLHELDVAYSAYRAGIAPDLPPPGYQFNDVILWTEEWLDRRGYRFLHDYWAKKLREVPLLTLPTDRSPEESAGATGILVHKRIKEPLTIQAQNAAVALGTTFAGFHYSILNALVRSWGNEATAHTAILCSWRRHPDAEGVIGNLANSVIAETDLRGNPRFRELVGRSRRSLQEAFDHRSFPATDMQRLAPLPRTCIPNPFQLSLIEEASYEFSLSGLEVEDIPRRSFTGTFTLFFQIGRFAGETSVRSAARPEFFSPSRSHQLLDQYERFLHLAVVNLDRKLDDFPTLSGECSHE